ncbi:hypothetical protein D1007_34763 [Hordeum vulgare]|nr:hypothetical protein D1007_34763 [Hordeum vulgare]
MPQRVSETRKSATRGGANLALARAKAYLRELDLAALKDGFPEYKLDGSKFSREDFARVMKETRPLATLLAEQVDTSQYYATYTSDNKRVPMPKDEPSELIPPHYKKKTAPDVGASTLTGMA